METVNGVDISELKDEDKVNMRIHANHHSKKHLQEMVKDLKSGKSFKISHEIAQRKVGK
tara:strand:- start:55 stop:231 length:177 start_codon:yes stop_codon:yes gene_type:complete